MGREEHGLGRKCVLDGLTSGFFLFVLEHLLWKLHNKCTYFGSLGYFSVSTVSFNYCLFMPADEFSNLSS